MIRALLLDRDGVLVADRGPVTSADALQVLSGVPEALGLASRAGLRLLLVTNQTVVARGLLDEAELAALHRQLEVKLRARGGPALDAVYACPHHPSATVPRYRVACDCRKPRPGLLLRAAREHGLTPDECVMIGDRPTDVAAGRRAGMLTVQVLSGRHGDPPIESPDGVSPACARPHHLARDLAGAVSWLLQSGPCERGRARAPELACAP